MSYGELKRRADEITPWITDARRELHMHPELGGQEANTQRFILDKMTELGIKAITYPGQTAVVGLIQGTFPGKTVALRADMDALPVQEVTGLPFASRIPGRMHACGHDAHMAIALGAARLLMENRARLHGQVKLLFEPAEETTGGARDMVAAGCMENPHVDAVLGLHMIPDQPAGVVYTKPGCVSGASDDIFLTVHGRGCHGAYPERGVDAVVIAAQIIMALQTLVSRNVSPLDSAVVSLGRIAGGAVKNVICDRVEIEGTLRTLKPETRAMLREKILSLPGSIAAAMGGSADVVLKDGYGAVYNDESLHEQFLTVAEGMVGKKNIVHRAYPSLGVESFSFFVANTPGMYYDLGCGVGSALHTGDFCVDESCLPAGASLQAAMVLDYLKG